MALDKQLKDKVHAQKVQKLVEKYRNRYFKKHGKHPNISGKIDEASIIRLMNRLDDDKVFNSMLCLAWTKDNHEKIRQLVE